MSKGDRTWQRKEQHHFTKKKVKEPTGSSREERPIRKDRRWRGWVEDDSRMISKATGA